MTISKYDDNSVIGPNSRTPTIEPTLPLSATAITSHNNLMATRLQTRLQTKSQLILRMVTQLHLLLENAPPSRSTPLYPYQFILCNKNTTFVVVSRIRPEAMFFYACPACLYRHFLAFPHLYILYCGLSSPTQERNFHPPPLSQTLSHLSWDRRSHFQIPH